MIFPEIFDGHVMGFFTDKELGVDVQGLTERRVYFPEQEHGSRVLWVKEDLRPRKADAVLTGRADILLGVKVADCVPILLFDRDNHAVGAVHAGWRGTAAGILKKTVAALRSEFDTRPETLLIALGPAIRWCCYQVKDNVLKAVMKETGDGRYWSRKNGKVCLDLQTANKLQALSLGVPEQNISVIDECTLCSPEKYYSYRRDHDATGRQGGFIGMP
ncbi:MAG: peptidoglycan editing factor PgeF [Nitrospirota bacterium]|jgi:YfiH family protein